LTVGKFAFSYTKRPWDELFFRAPFETLEELSFHATFEALELAYDRKVELLLKNNTQSV